MTEGYAERFCAFVDVLGFKQMVSDSRTDQEALNRILHAATGIENLIRVSNISFSGDRQATQFSDCFVLSIACAPVRYQELNYLIWALGRLAIELSESGVFLRGGITKGQLIHKPPTLFGPAMVRAYELESTKAIHPRIIIEESLHSEWLANTPEAGASDDDYAGFARRAVQLDTDGQWFIDYINWQRLVPYHPTNAYATEACHFLRHLQYWINTH